MANNIAAEAFEWIKKNKKLLIQKFCNPEDFPSYENPTILFMAGAPGAGKTEFSKSLVEIFQKNKLISKFIRIDADEIRKLIPQFHGSNSSEVQRAASKGVSMIFDEAMHHKQNIILDGTFANLAISRENIIRALKKTSRVGIFYLYQEPALAWEFTQVREKKEGRNIAKNVFIESFLNSRKNVNLIKTEFGQRIDLNLIIQNRDNGVKQIYSDIDNLDNYLKNLYDQSELEKIIG